MRRARVGIVTSSLGLLGCCLGGCTLPVAPDAGSTPSTRSTQSATAPVHIGAPSSTTTGSDAPSSTATSTGTTTATSRQHPRELSLTGVAPCSLITDAQRKSLGMTTIGTPDTNPVLHNAPMCTFSDEHEHLGFALTAARADGLAAFGPGRVPGRISHITVLGRPALRTQPRDPAPGHDLCGVTVGIRSGQALDVLFAENATEAELGQRVLCAHAKQVAHDALTTLRARR
ncbi:MAG: DUF3558 domain-containing protein [Sciscionella sp.]